MKSLGQILNSMNRSGSIGASNVSGAGADAGKDKSAKSVALLPKLVAKARRLQEVDQLLRSFLDHEMAQHCVLADVKNNSKGKLEALLIADNAAWATRLRYAIPELLKNVRTQPEFKELKKIRYGVRSEVSGVGGGADGGTIGEICGTAASEKAVGGSESGGVVAVKSKKWDSVAPQNRKQWQETLQQLKEKVRAKKHARVERLDELDGELG